MQRNYDTSLYYMYVLISYFTVLYSPEPVISKCSRLDSYCAWEPINSGCLIYIPNRLIHGRERWSLACLRSIHIGLGPTCSLTQNDDAETIMFYYNVRNAVWNGKIPVGGGRVYYDMDKEWVSEFDCTTFNNTGNEEPFNKAIDNKNNLSRIYVQHSIAQFRSNSVLWHRVQQEYRCVLSGVSSMPSIQSHVQ